MVQCFLNCFGFSSVNKFCDCCAVSWGLPGAAPPAPSWVSPEAGRCTKPGLGCCWVQMCRGSMLEASNASCLEPKPVAQAVGEGLAEQLIALSAQKSMFPELGSHQIWWQTIVLFATWGSVPLATQAPVLYSSLLPQTLFASPFWRLLCVRGFLISRSTQYSPSQTCCKWLFCICWWFCTTLLWISMQTAAVSLIHALPPWFPTRREHCHYDAHLCTIWDQQLCLLLQEKKKSSFICIKMW